MAHDPLVSIRWHFLALSLLMGAANTVIFGQKMSAGYIVTLEKDTLRGFIVEGTDLELGLAVKFNKTESPAGSIAYAPKDLLGFGLNYGRTFERFSNPGSSPADADSSYFFAKRIVTGKLRLYTAVTPNDQSDMVLVNTVSHRKVYLSEPKKVTIDENGQKKIVEVQKHLGLIAYAKGDPTINYSGPNRIRYTEKSIKSDILKYNNQFASDFPVTVYNPRINYFNDITFGGSIANAPEGSTFRIAYYRNKYSPEATKTFSSLMGISYRHWASNEPFNSNVANSSLNYKQDFISVIPLGLNFHTGSGPIRPYFYFGIGLAFLINTNHNVVNFVDKGSVTELIYFPTLNPGAGVKIKTGSQFILIEFTTTGNGGGQFLNFGFSF